MFIFLKRFFDITFSFISIIILIPFFVIVSLILLLATGRPVLISQKRIGRYNKVFKLYKFRTMTNRCRSEENYECYNERITRIGRFMRRSSLDELPQLFNILIGHMSLIGPRPKTVKETLFIKETEYIFRHSVRPGLTGLAAVEGRNSLNPDTAYELDLKYVKNISLLLDFKIFFKTFFVVLTKAGVDKSEDIPFIPHELFWNKKGLLTSSEIDRLTELAEDIERSDVKFLENSNMKSFIMYRRNQKTF